MSPARARLSLPQFAELVGCSPQHVWALSKDGVIPRPVDGTIPLGPSLKRYLAHISKAPKVTTARRNALVEERVRKLRMENDALAVNLVDAGFVQALHDSWLAALAVECDDFVDRAPRDRELRARLEQEVAQSQGRIRATMTTALREVFADDEDADDGGVLVA